MPTLGHSRPARRRAGIAPLSVRAPLLAPAVAVVGGAWLAAQAAGAARAAARRARVPRGRWRGRGVVARRARRGHAVELARLGRAAARGSTACTRAGRWRSPATWPAAGTATRPGTAPGCARDGRASGGASSASPAASACTCRRGSGRAAAAARSRCAGYLRPPASLPQRRHHRGRRLEPVGEEPRVGSRDRPAWRTGARVRCATGSPLRAAG